MNTRKQIATSVMAIFITIAVSTPALARSPQHHRWEGVAIGIGAAILGKALFEAHRRPYAEAAPQPVVVEQNSYYAQPEPEPAGYWEIRKHWVPPVVKKVWNPGHYNRRGHWVSGHWISIEEAPGHWIEKKVWVPYY